MSRSGPPDQTLNLPGSSKPVPGVAADWRLDEHVRQLTWLVYEFARDVPAFACDRLRDYTRSASLATQSAPNVTALPVPATQLERIARLARMTDDAWAALRTSAQLTQAGLIENDEQLTPVYREALARAASTNGG